MEIQEGRISGQLIIHSQEQNLKKKEKAQLGVVPSGISPTPDTLRSWLPLTTLCTELMDIIYTTMC